MNEGSSLEVDLGTKVEQNVSLSPWNHQTEYQDIDTNVDNRMTVRILLPVFLFFLLSFFVALVAAIYRLVYTMIIKFRLTQRFRRSARHNFRSDGNSAPPYPFMEEPPSYISLFPASYSQSGVIANMATAQMSHDVDGRPDCCSPLPPAEIQTHPHLPVIPANLARNDHVIKVKEESQRAERKRTYTF
ncbi:unnamed protein product [Oikopleura dioica]|uniref:Uncharacterized protein n=1 Tax=Oikopleura dioica TaxID=34765 RepID=E4YH75_OIKDI|nr:unnamed protein product [Oikopleura dioica]